MKRFLSLFLVFAFFLNTFGICAFAQVPGNNGLNGLNGSVESNAPTTSNGQTMANQAPSANNNARNPIYGTWVINPNDLDIVAIVIRKNSSVIFTGDDSKHQITSIEGAKIVSDLGEFTLEVVNRTGIVGYQNDNAVFDGLKKGTRPPAPANPITSFTGAPTEASTNPNPQVNASNGPSTNGANAPINGPSANGANAPFNGPSANGNSFNGPSDNGANAPSNGIEEPLSPPSPKQPSDLGQPKTPQSNLPPLPDLNTMGGAGTGINNSSMPTPNTQSEQPTTPPQNTMGSGPRGGTPGTSFGAIPVVAPNMTGSQNPGSTFFDQPTIPTAQPPYNPSILPSYPGQTNNGSTGFNTSSTSTTSGIPGSVGIPQTNTPRPSAPIAIPNIAPSNVGTSQPSIPKPILNNPTGSGNQQPQIGPYDGPPDLGPPPQPPTLGAPATYPVNPIQPPPGGVAAAGIGSGAAIGASVGTQPQAPPISPGGIGRGPTGTGAVFARGVNIPAGTINPITGESSNTSNNKNNGSNKIKIKESNSMQGGGRTNNDIHLESDIRELHKNK